MANLTAIAHGVVSNGTYHQYQNRILLLENDDWNLIIESERYPKAELLQLKIEISQALIFVYTWLQTYSEIQSFRDSLGPFITWTQFFNSAWDLILDQESSDDLRREAMQLKALIAPHLPALKAYISLEHRMYFLSEIIDLLGLIWLFQKLMNPNCYTGRGL